MNRNLPSTLCTEVIFIKGNCLYWQYSHVFVRQKLLSFKIRLNHCTETF